MERGLDDHVEPPSLVVYGHVGFDVSTLGAMRTVQVGGASYYATLSASLITRSVGLVAVGGEDFPVSQLGSLGVDMSGFAIKPGLSAVFAQDYNPARDVTRLSVDLNASEDLSPKLVPSSYLGCRLFFITTAPPHQQDEILRWLTRTQFQGSVAVDTTLAYVDDFRGLLVDHANRIQHTFMNAQEYDRLGRPPPAHVSCIVKRGAAGASLWRDGIWRSFPAPHVEQVVDTTGAGDILAGAYLAGLSTGWAPHQALSRAIALATRSVTSCGVEHLRVGHHAASEVIDQ
jgi:sugar/nucleoside kinase (ribokinase family)